MYTTSRQNPGECQTPRSTNIVIENHSTLQIHIELYLMSNDKYKIVPSSIHQIFIQNLEKIHLLFTCLQLSVLLRKAIIITFSSESIIISPNFVITYGWINFLNYQPTSRTCTCVQETLWKFLSILIMGRKTSKKDMSYWL
ncbi:hypothetical protein V1478_004181 [Vespula squamosa]|uniref:Uncharacterized protein n=1 Tax=Vespula squamosa TaxID=30214 RepID=A0ABD2BK13_VESSQ